MTAVARVAAAVVLVLAAALVMLWAGTRPSGFAGVVRVAVMAAAVGAAVLAWFALQPKGGKP
jgi:hypothetical protein